MNKQLKQKIFVQDIRDVFSIFKNWIDNNPDGNQDREAHIRNLQNCQEWVYSRLKKTPWRDLELELSAHEGELNIKIDPLEFAKTIRDYRDGCMDEWFFADSFYEPNCTVDEDGYNIYEIDPADYGPEPEEIDWTGIDEFIAKEEAKQ